MEVGVAPERSSAEVGEMEKRKRRRIAAPLPDRLRDGDRPSPLGEGFGGILFDGVMEGSPGQEAGGVEDGERGDCVVDDQRDFGAA